MSDLDKLEFSKQVVELQKQVQEMEAEAEADAKDKPPKDEVSAPHSQLTTYKL